MESVSNASTKEDETSLSLAVHAPVDVLVVDKGAVIRDGLCALIERHPDLVVVGQASSVDECRFVDVIPDVIVTDIDLPDAKHDEVVIALRSLFSQSSILVLTFVEHPLKVESVLAAGAQGYVLKTAESIDLISGIRAVASGESYLQPSLGIDLAYSHRPRDTTLGLTPKEQDVLRLLALGHTNAEAAARCDVSLRTIEAHRAHIHQKLGLRTRAELVQYARDIALFDFQ